MQRIRTSVSVIAYCIVLCAMIGIVLLNIPSVGSVELGTHAVERHASEATLAREWIVANAGPFNRYDCPDGRIRYAVYMPGGKWAIMVIEDGKEITSFISDLDYMRSITDPCDQWMKFAHP